MLTSSFQTTSTFSATTTAQSSAINSTTSSQESITEPKNLALKTDSSSSSIASSTTYIASQATSSDPSSTTSSGSSRNEFTSSAQISLDIDLDLEQTSTATTPTTSLSASVSAIENADEAALPVATSSAPVPSFPQISSTTTSAETSKNSFSTISHGQDPPPASLVIDTTTTSATTLSTTTASSIGNVIDTTTSSSTTSTSKSTSPSFVIDTTTSSATTLTTTSQQVAASPSEQSAPPPPATHTTAENNDNSSTSGISIAQQQPVQLQVDAATSETAVATTSTTNAIDPADAAATGISDTYVAPIVAHGGLNSLGEERSNGSGGRADTDVITSNPVIIPGASKLALGALTMTSSSTAAEGSANSFLAIKGIPTFVIIMMFGVFLVCMTVAVFFGVRWHMGGRHGKGDGEGKDIVDLERQLHTRTARKTISFLFDNDDEHKSVDYFTDLQWKIQQHEDSFLQHSSDSSEIASSPIDASDYSVSDGSFNVANEEVAGITMMRNSVFSHASDSTDASLPPMPKFKSLALSDISIP